jgi:curved DNA-binding protein CbpA
MNPYRVLGVKKTATQDEIKEAYRKKARLHHPDRGGDENKFNQITEAYQILSNQDTKACYDNTGEAKAPKVSRDAQEVRKVMLMAFATVINDLQQQKVDHKIIDFVRAMVVAIEMRVSELRATKTQLTEILGRLIDVVDRFVTAGENDMKSIIENERDEVSARIEHMDKIIAHHNEAKRLIKTYKYKFTPQLSSGWIFSGERADFDGKNTTYSWKT